MESFQVHPASVARLLYLIPLIPLLGAAVNGLFGRKLGRGNVHLIALGAVAASFLISLGVFLSLLGGSEPLKQTVYDWIVVGDFSLPIAFVADKLSAILLLVVTGIGFFIHLYSIGYMAHDEAYARFFAYLNLFIGMMLVLVLGASLPVLFIGWEGVGLCSYLLIGFWFSSTANAIAGKKAFIANRVGDLGFLIGMFALYSLFGTLDIGSLNEAAARVSVHAMLPQAAIFSGWTYGAAITFAMLALFVGCTGKSAQIPLFVWLPDAMAGPTPVSALIHAATMVTAGVYLLTRLSPLLVLSPTAMTVVASIGALTALVGAFMALFQRGIKKVLAYSTISQLGYMFLGVGVGAFYAGTFHLVTHAFFKACLFLAAGSVMHAMSNEEDIHLMGGLHKKIKHTHWTFLVATIAITGVLPLSGFFSKDMILHEALVRNLGTGPVFPWVLWGMGTLAAFFTSIYMWRLYLLTFRGQPRSGHLYEQAHESPYSMTVPLMVLALGAIGAAVFGLPEMIQEKFHWAESLSFHHWLEEVTRSQAVPVTGEASEALFLGIALGVGLLGLLVAWLIWGKLQVRGDHLASARLGFIYKASLERLWWDQGYLAFIVMPLVGFSKALWRGVDVFLIDGILVEGPARLARLLGQLLRPLQNGDAQRYAAIVAVGAALLIAAFFGWHSLVANDPANAFAAVQPVHSLQRGAEVQAGSLSSAASAPRAVAMMEVR